MSSANTSRFNVSGLLDADSPETLRMTVDEATELGIRSVCRLGYSTDDAKIIVDQLIDNALCGYGFASLPRILAIAADEKTRQPQRPVKVIHETPLSALVDGGNNVGYLTVYRGTQIAIDKARRSGFAVVGIFDSYYSGRNGYFMEMIAKAGFIGIHVASGKPRVLPIGGIKPALGTNPICVGFPSLNGPVVFDMGTASLMWGEVLLSAHLGKELPEGVGFDSDGNPTRDAEEAIDGGVVPFGGHKGYGLSFVVQALGLLAGAAITRGNVQDYGFLFFVVDPKLMLPSGEFPIHMTELVQKIKDTPRRSGVDEIRIPSERAYRERERRRSEGIVLNRAVVDSLNAL